MVRTTGLISIFLATALTAACASAPEGAAQPAPTRATLTDTQVEKYINSYRSAYAMMSTYWGKRRYTPPNKMLPRQGTLDRAVAEMRAAGTLPDFELLLQGYGFDSIDSWNATGQRISYAYITLRQESRDPAGLIRRRQARDNKVAALAKHRATLLARNNAESRAELRHLDVMEKQVQRSLIADADAEILRPRYDAFEALSKEIIERER